MARTKRRRTHTGHPGVKLKRRRRTSDDVWLARWIEPETGRNAETSLTKLGLSTAEARRAWAVKKSEDLATRRRKIAAGGAEVRPWAVPEAVKDYLDRASQRLAEHTVVGYRDSLSRFEAWAKEAGVRYLNNLTPMHLAMARDAFARARKRVVVRSGQRGERRTGKAPYSSTSINSRLRDVRVFLHEARRFGRTPHLDRDAITDGLSSIRGERSRPEFLRPAELRELLEACLRHDADCYTLTREEKDGSGTPGTTPKHPPIAPFTLYTLLSGCRLGEARGLRWEWCYLAGEEPEIILPAGAVKTRHERSIDLKISPAIVKLLQALRLRSGGRPYVFGSDLPLSEDLTKAAHRRLTVIYGAPPFTWQRLRSTCATYLANAPGIYGAASIFLESKRLGHSVTVSEARYAGLIRDIPKTAATLEEAMGIPQHAARIVAAAGGADAAAPNAEAV